MGPVIMDLDMVKIGRVLESWILPVNVLQPAMDVREIVL